MSPVNTPPVPIPKQAAFSRVMTVIEREGKHYLSMVVNGKSSEQAFDTHDEAVKAVAEERRKGPNDYLTTSS